MAAFHHIAAHELADPEHPIESDLLVAGDAAAAGRQVLGPGEAIAPAGDGAGGLETAQTTGRLTPLLIGLNIRYGSKRGGMRFTGLRRPER